MSNKTGLLCVLAATGMLATTAAPSVALDGEEPDRLPEKLARYDLDGDGRLSRSELPRRKAEQLLKRLDGNGDGALDPSELAPIAKKLGGAKPPSDSGAKVIENITYEEGTSDSRKLDLYIPRGEGPHPVLFWTHGGGLHAGDKAKLAGVGQRFAGDGFVVVAVNYRLSPAVRYPAHIEDVAKAFAWVHKNITEFAGDPQRIFCTGGSAGGHLTALLSLDSRYLAVHGLTTEAIKASIPISGLMDVAQASPARIGTVWEDDPEVLREASPLTHARADAPPMLILYADGDTPERRRQNVQMHEALSATGHSDVVIKELADRTHNSVRPNLENDADPGARAMIAFMTKHGARDVPQR